MAHPILMPQIGQDIPAGKIIEWFVEEGDDVSSGDIIAQVESEKATFEVEALEGGTVLKLLFAAGDDAEVLKPIGFIGEAGEDIPENGNGSKPAALKPEDKAAEPAVTSPEAAVPTAGTRMTASPAALRFASEKGVDIQGVKGTGPGGRIIKKDILAAAAAPAPAVKVQSAPAPAAAGEDTEIVFDRMRKAIADRLTLSKQTIPHFYLQTDVDMTAAMAWRKAFNEKHQYKITINDLVLAAAADGLKRFPNMNAHVSADRMVVKKDINIGVAVSVENGLLVPVLEKADTLELQELSRRVKEIAAAAQRGVQKPGAAGTFTVSNLGMFGIGQFTPIINPPECGILGVGGIRPAMVPLPGNGFAVRQMMGLTLAGDHRAVDGTYAAGCLNAVKSYLEDGLIP